MNSRQIKLQGRRDGGTWGPPQRGNRDKANRATRSRVNRGDFDEAPQEWDFDHPMNLDYLRGSD